MSKRREGFSSSNGVQSYMQVGEAVVVAVAEVEDVSPFDLSPLADAIDPDALDSFVDSLGSGTEEPTGFVEFEYRGHAITVTADGAITVDERSPA